MNADDNLGENRLFPPKTYFLPAINPPLMLGTRALFMKHCVEPPIAHKFSAQGFRLHSSQSHYWCYSINPFKRIKIPRGANYDNAQICKVGDSTQPKMHAIIQVLLMFNYLFVSGREGQKHFLSLFMFITIYDSGPPHPTPERYDLPFHLLHAS